MDQSNARTYLFRGGATSSQGALQCTWAAQTRGTQRCGKWQCLACAQSKARQLAADVEAGLAEATALGMRARFWTITDSDNSSLRRFIQRCQRLSSNLGAAGLRWDHYVATLGPGRLHRHLVAVGGPYVHPSKLEAHAERAGLGFIKVREIPPSHYERYANYMARNAGGFAAQYAGTLPRLDPVTHSHTTIAT